MTLAVGRDIITANGDVWTGGNDCGCVWCWCIPAAVVCLFVSWLIYNAPLLIAPQKDMISEMQGIRASLLAHPGLGRADDMAVIACLETQLSQAFMCAQVQQESLALACLDAQLAHIRACTTLSTATPLPPALLAPG